MSLDGWEEVTLGDACVVIRGSSPRPIKQYLTDDKDGVNWVKIGDTKNVDKVIMSTRQRITRKGSERSRPVSPGDLLLSNSMSYGKPYVMGINGFVHDGWFVLRNFAETFEPDFFYILLTSNLVQEQFGSLAAGAVVKNISSDLVKKAVLPVPPLAEQKRIVSILDEAFSAIAKAKENAEKNLLAARELFESYLASVTDEKKSLGEYVDIKTGKLNANAAVEGGQYPFFTCSRERYAIDHFAFDCDAVLLAGNNASGDFNVKHYIGKFNAYQRTYVITVTDKSKLLSRFLYFQLTNSLKELKRSSVGSNTRFLKLGMIKELKICVPDLEKQTQLLSVIENLQASAKRLETIYTQKLANLNELKQSLLQKAFTGQLTREEVSV